MELEKLKLLLIEQEERERVIKPIEGTNDVVILEKKSNASFVITADNMAHIIIEHFEAQVLSSTLDSCQNETTEAGRQEQVQ
jgi:virulence-associated protein VagC